MRAALEGLYALEERYSKYSFVVVLPTGIAMIACLGNVKLVKIFGLITLVLGHLLLGVRFRRLRMSGYKRTILNLVFWEIALLAIILGWVLVFGWKEEPLGWIFVVMVFNGGNIVYDSEIDTRKVAVSKGWLVEMCGSAGDTLVVNVEMAK